jgi:hypothetical protein
MKSIIQENKDNCFNCGRYGNLERHHCIHGIANRPKADKYGLTVYLCASCHRGTNGVHGKNGHGLDIQLKRIAQKKFEEKYSREKFMETFGRNYLDD